MNDLGEVKDMHIGTLYRNAPRCQEFASAIAEIQSSKIIKPIGECKFFVVIVGRSTDSSITESEKIYILICKGCLVQCGTAKCI